jgi:hypothetical protein
MKCHPVLVLAFFIGAVSSCIFGDEQQPKASPAAQIEISEVDYMRCQSVLTEFAQNYPKLTLAQRVEGYYSVGQCWEKLGQSYRAMLSYAKAVTVGEELAEGATAAKAKQRLGQLYGITHNGTLVGIDKIYKKAKESMVQPEK